MPPQISILYLSLFFIFYSCNEKKIPYSNTEESVQVEVKMDADSIATNKEQDSVKTSYYDLSEDLLDKNVYYEDTVTVHTTEELIQQIKSNRLIRLGDAAYILKTASVYQDPDKEGMYAADEKQALLIDGVKNLKIVGTGSSKLLASERDAIVLRISNSYNIHLDGIQIGHTEAADNACQEGALRISHSYNLTISNCKLFGFGTYGLITSDVNNLEFSDSEITECTVFIFDLEKSRNLEFINSTFHHNNLAAAVLGGFTNSTKEVRFLDCGFLENKPRMAGNPVFNFMGNDTNFKEKIVFENCTFKNNKGYKWYGDKIKLDNCKIDSLDFIDFLDRQ